MTSPSRRKVLSAALPGLAALSLPGLARAQTPSPQQAFPSKTVTMIVPYPAGGPTDVIARIIAQALEAPLGQKVIVENRAGASGAIGTRTVAGAEPDGHTIVFGNNQTHGNNMFLLKAPGYDALADFAPIAGVGAFRHLFVVRNGLPAKSIAELVALAKAKPGELNYGSTGTGSGSHLALELFMARTGTKMAHIHYKGAAPLVQDIVGDRIDVSNSTLPSVLAQVKAGTMRALAVASATRAPALPDVPTLSEAGVLGADIESWTALFAPAKTPAPVLDTLSAATLAVLAQPSVVAAIDKLGFSIDARTPNAFRAYHENEQKVWAEIIKAAAIQPE